MITLIVGLVVIVAIGYAAFWFIGSGSLPEPVAMLLRVIVVLLGLFALYHLALGAGLHIN